MVYLKKKKKKTLLAAGEKPLKRSLSLHIALQKRQGFTLHLLMHCGGGTF
jgi:hypothetical protein